MNWYSINFSLYDIEVESETEIMEWFQGYLGKHSLYKEALLYESDELTEQGTIVFVYSRNAALISEMKKKYQLEKCLQPAKEEICLIAGARDLGDSLFY